MPGEIEHLIRMPVSVVLTETRFRALEALAKAENMTLDDEISSLIGWGLYSAIQICEGMSEEQKRTLMSMLKKHGES